MTSLWRRTLQLSLCVVTLGVEGGWIDRMPHEEKSMKFNWVRSKNDKEEKVLEGVENGGKSAYSDEAWKPAEMLYEPPLLQVTQPKGSFCTIDCRFATTLEPDGVYDILTDPNNHRVFKNIKEVIYRKVLEDDGNRQVVEVEQLGRWKFLFLSGTFPTRVMIEQKRQEKTIVFDLAKQGGIMKKFTGSWKIEPMRASEAASQNVSTSVGVETEPGSDPILGSWITFQQVVEPSIKPPWPLSNYIRGVSDKIVREMLADLQQECQRLTELRKTSTSASKVVANAQPSSS
ncbi:uncharacterized protein [Physcomitrium patens]|uniref:uncharacterized protein isoform X1 n=1 Tax=Physcomitrium patens TaxID=3218 RepID=UPI00024B14E4|nr:uncharacterized protein LOC112283580 isoform X1 [Physcomitrium patens]|eukprot:XP_024378238.1 uncharacterized protein LOC112283580 isoform X1 [Physcomitrella patens]